VKEFIAGFQGNKIVVSAMATYSETYPTYSEMEGDEQVFYLSPAQDDALTPDKVKALADVAEHEFKARGLEVTRNFI
jgi:hypothetical protein